MRKEKNNFVYGSFFFSGADLTKTNLSLKLFHKFLVFAAALLFACEEGEPFQPADHGFEYYPLQTGMYSIFEVNETRYSQLSQPQILNYELKTQVVDSFRNAEGDFTFVIYRYTRPDSDAEWIFLDTWSARTNSDEAIASEGSVPYVKLSFPLSHGIRWDGNKRNNDATDEYEVKSLGEPMTINNLTFDNTLTVEQESYDDKVTRTDLRTEIFAKNVGLIRKETTQLTYCTEVICLDDRIIESGIIFQQAIKQYGIQ